MSFVELRNYDDIVMIKRGAKKKLNPFNYFFTSLVLRYIIDSKHQPITEIKSVQ
jgi:hypothetical protein